MKEKEIEKKFYKVMRVLKKKEMLSPEGEEIDYNTHYDKPESLSNKEKVKILNKLEEKGILEIKYNSGSKYS